uniref:hypothetical protein RF1 n=1 Tax=Gueldenstaedtia verna TaxID=714474 RepID=UPI002E767F0D|nr:hypothetical protein RF1 [Gueldenstaedtia verna]WRI15654.1 hypothetical protein RF1 [Gueldenstaedtia verna]
MIFNFWRLDSLVGLFLRRLVQSVAIVGVYYGFLLAFAIGPSYLFLLRARFMYMEKGGENQIEKQVAATAGYFTGQLLMLTAIFYEPIHLALNRPHSLAVLILFIVVYQTFRMNDLEYCKNDFKYLEYSEYFDDLDAEIEYFGPSYALERRRFIIWKVFFNNLGFQLINPLIFPTSVLLRLTNVYLYQCTGKGSAGKGVYSTSIVFGWLLGNFFLRKLIEFIFSFLKQNEKHLIKWIQSIKTQVTIFNVTLGVDKYTLLELRDYVFTGQLFVVFGYSLLLHYLGRIPLLYIYSDEIVEMEEKEKNNFHFRQISSGEIDHLQKFSTYVYTPLLKKEEPLENRNDLFLFKQPLVKILFDFQRRLRPSRYIKNPHFENAVRDQNSQFYFHICKSDGKARISFTYPQDLSTFHKMIEKKLDIFTRDQISDNEFYNSWLHDKQDKIKKLSKELFKRAKLLDSGFHPLDVLENRIRLSKDEKKTRYLISKYDPFLNGRFRGEIQKSFSPENYTTNSILVNKIHGILLSMNSQDPELEQKQDPFERESLSTKIGFFFNLMKNFSEKSVSSLNFDRLFLFPEHEQVKTYSEEKKRQRKFFDTIRTDLNDPTSLTRKIKEIGKILPRWSYKLIDEVEQFRKKTNRYPQIRVRNSEPILMVNIQPGELLSTKRESDHDENLFNTKTDKKKDSYNSKSKSKKNKMMVDRLSNGLKKSLVKYSREPNFTRGVISGAMRAHRRKIATLTAFIKNGNAHSPLFLYRIQQMFGVELFNDLFLIWKEMFRKEGTETSEEYLKVEERLVETTREQEKDDQEYRMLQIEEYWEEVFGVYGLNIRNVIILAVSYIRKYICLPSVIITKNIIRMLLFQYPEWREDFLDWKKEIHIRCNYHGVPVSETGFPENWLREGLQIRVLSPFVLKPWHKSKPKVRFTEKKKRFSEKKNGKELWYLSAIGILIPSYTSSIQYADYYVEFLVPIKKIQKYLIKSLKNRFFLVLKVFNENKWKIKKILRLSRIRFRKIIQKNPMIAKLTVLVEPVEPVELDPSFVTKVKDFSTKAKDRLTDEQIKAKQAKTRRVLNEIKQMMEEFKQEERNYRNSEEYKNSQKSKIQDEYEYYQRQIKLNSNKTTELQKNRFQILQGRTVRLIRKSSSFFKLFMEGLYIDILLSSISITRINVQLFLESKIKIVTKYISKKQKNEKTKRIDKTNESLIPFIFTWIMEQSSKIRNTNSQNSFDVSFLSQEYVLFQISQIGFSNVYKYKLKSIFESHGRFSFLKNEIKNQIQGLFNSKFSHKELSDSVMNQWTNWFKIHSQYDLPQSRWSRLVPQKWRKIITEHRLAQNKDVIESDSAPLSVYKKEQVDSDLLELNKKIKKQYRYDLFAYQYLHYADKKNSYFSGYRAANDNTRKKEFLERIYDISIETFLPEEDLAFKKRNLFDWKGMTVEIHKESTPDANKCLSNPIDSIPDPNKCRSNPIDSIPDPNNCLWNQKDLRSNPEFYIVRMRHHILSPILREANEEAAPRTWKRFFKKHSWTVVKTFVRLVTYYRAFRSPNRLYEVSANMLMFELQDSCEDLIKRKRKEQTTIKKLDLSKASFIVESDVSSLYAKYDLREERDFLLEKYLGVHLHFDNFSHEEEILDYVQWSLILFRMKNQRRFFIRSLLKGDVNLDAMAILQRSRGGGGASVPEILNERKHKQFFSLEPLRRSRKNYAEFLPFQMIKISVGAFSVRNMDQEDLPVPESILSTKHRRELRMLLLLCLSHSNPELYDNENPKAWDKMTDRERREFETRKLVCYLTDRMTIMKLQFLWPNFRFEDLACMNRFWFDSMNGSRFSTIRITLFPRLIRFLIPF